MPLRKSDLYASIWSAADVLRGGMDASQYKDYVLTLLFMKYVSDRAKSADALIELPPQQPPPPEDRVGDGTIGYGGSFDDMVFWKNKKGIGTQLNQIVTRFATHNGLSGSITTANFNDPEKLGDGKEMIERLSKLIGIFQDERLNFGGNRAGGDDLLGDAYEYLMRNFATQSGKSKGQFYTPAEVSRIVAAVLGVDRADRPSYTVYDPTCGSGSLLLKVADASPRGLTIYGQERDITTRGMAVMNMWLHGYPEAVLRQGNTLSDPKFKEHRGDKEVLNRFDFVVANPPFSDKTWSTGITPENDTFDRFKGFGVPPTRNGDYAFLLHVVASLKTGGTAAIILPHGVLFRGNAEAEIRKNLLEAGLIRGIIGLPANLFYGTGIPACIIVLHKPIEAEGPGRRSAGAIFLLDASKDYRKDGPKNRLRERDIHRIVDVFNARREVPGYSRLVPLYEIAGNDYNLNLPRYIENTDGADKQDLAAHLRGGIPVRDVDALNKYWKHLPGLRKSLFVPLRENYISPAPRRPEIEEHEEFQRLREELRQTFDDYWQALRPWLAEIGPETKPAGVIERLSEELLALYRERPLVNAYAVYQHLMDYWDETMQDDVYTIVASGWRAELQPEMTGKGDKRKVRKGYYVCDLLPTEVVRDRYFQEEQDRLTELENRKAEAESNLAELEEEEGGDDGQLSEVVNEQGNITKGEIKSRLKALKGSKDAEDVAERKLLNRYLELDDERLSANRDIKALEKKLRLQVYKQYEKLDAATVRELVLDHKWYADLSRRIGGETTAVGHFLSGRVNELTDRYARPLPELEEEVTELSERVKGHLEKMGLEW